MPRPIVPEGEASVFGITANIVSNVIGGGCLLLPSAFHDASLIPGILGLLLMGFLAIMSIFYMILCCERTKRYTYKDLLTIGVHPRAGYFFEIVLFSYTYLILVGWARIIVDSMPPVARQFLDVSPTSPFASDWFWLIAAACIFFPLSSMKQLAHLTWSSVVGFLTILYVALVMFARFVDGFYTKNWEPQDAFPCSTWNESLYVNGSSIFADPSPQSSLVHDGIKLFDITFLLVTAFPQFSVAYSCHYNIPPFFAELRRRTPLRMLRAAVGAYSIIAVFYVFVGTSGILTFGPGIKEAKGDVLKCYSFKDTAMNIGRLLMFFHFCCVFPIVAIATRRAFNALVFPGKVLSHPVLIVEAFVIVLTCCIVAYLVPGISVVFTLDGAMFGLSIVLIIPGLFYYRIFSDKFDLAAAEHKLDEYYLEQERQARLKNNNNNNNNNSNDNNNNNNNNNHTGDNSLHHYSDIIGISSKHFDQHQHRQQLQNQTPAADDVAGTMYPVEVLSESSATGTTTTNTTTNTNTTNTANTNTNTNTTSNNQRNVDPYNSVRTPPQFVTSDAQMRQDQGYGNESETNVEDGEAEYLLRQQHQTTLLTESIPTEWDIKLQGFVDRPSRALRYMAMFSMFFGAAMSILSLVKAIKSIAD